MKKNLLNFLLFSLIICILSQFALADGPHVQWQKTFGGSSGDWGKSVQQTSDGGFIVAGHTYSFGAGHNDVYLIKTDSAGNLLWQKTFGGSDYDYGSSVQETTDGGFIIAGFTWSFDEEFIYDVYLIKTDPNGESQWQKTFGGSSYDESFSVQQTSDGGFIIAGNTYSFGDPNGDVYLIKTDSAGNKIWQKTFGGSSYDSGYSVQKTSDGGFIITGCTYSFEDPNGDVYLIKTDPNGESQWQKSFGGSNFDGGDSVQEITDGGYIIAGTTYSFGEPNGDVYLIKTDSAGNSLWQKTFGGSSYDGGYSVQQTSDSGYIIAGTTYSFGLGDGVDVYLIKTDPNGNLLWQKTFGGFYPDIGSSVQKTTDGGYIIAGGTSSFGAGSYDVYLIKLCSENALLGDLNCDGLVDFYDFAILANQWLLPPTLPSADIAPGAGDNFVDTLDLAAFVEYWLKE